VKIYNYETTEGYGEKATPFKLEARLEQGRVLDEVDQKVIYKHLEALRKELQGRTTALDPVNKAAKVEWLTKARDCFAEAGMPAVYIQETDNEYCGALCCPHLPWLLVTTEIGIFKVGWRKRVMSLDWGKTQISASAHELFPDENVTKVGHEIHCWSYAKLGQYLKGVYAAATASAPSEDEHP
jgi:hypothetical protein